MDILEKEIIFVPKYMEPSERQLKLISKIKEEVGIGFTGDTYQEACEYIDEHLDDYELIMKVKNDAENH